MELRFLESMRGALTGDGDGRAGGLVLELSVLAPSLLRFLRDGRTEVRGIVRAPPWVPASPALGTLVLSPRELIYRLELTGPEGAPLVLEGRKRPRITAPLRSMTHMEAALRDGGGRLVASGYARFDLRELPAYLRSFLPLVRRGQRELDARRRELERRRLDGGAP